MANSFYGPFFIINGQCSEWTYTSYSGSMTVTFSSEPLAWRWERMCRDAGRVLFGNILTAEV